MTKVEIDAPIVFAVNRKSFDISQENRIFKGLDVFFADRTPARITTS